MDATSFYDRLAPLFDMMTDWDSRLEFEGPFLCRLLEQAGARAVLDAACGSGGHALALARWGYRVVGTDISPVMVALAREKAGEAQVAFHVAGLGELASRFSPFDAVLCLGNSLPHLLTEAELQMALQDLASSLRPDGLLVLHNLNYDRRWRERPRWFAVSAGTHQGRQALVWRFADYIDTPQPRIDFHIALFHEQSDGQWTSEVHSTPQRPLFRADLARLLPAAGMTDIAYYGDLSGAAFDPDNSPDLVVVARRSR